MYRVKYYMTGGTLTSKTFETFHDATMFAITRVLRENVYAIDKV